VIKKFTGETIIMPIEVVSDELTNLDGVKIVFCARHDQVEIIKTPTVEGMIVTARLESAETLVPGIYYCEFRALIGGVTKVLDYDVVLITNANIREVITNG